MGTAKARALTHIEVDDDGAFFPVQRSLLSARALVERVLPNYSLPDPVACHFWHRGINDAYLIETNAARFVLRISPAHWRSYAHLMAEMDLLRFLHQHEITVPQPVQKRDGTFAQRLSAPEGPRYAVLFTFVPGVPHTPTEAHSHRFGRAIAQFHTVTDGYPADRAGLRFEPDDMVDVPLARLEPLFGAHQDDWAYLLQISTGLKQAASTLPRKTPEYGICHGDVNNSNLHLIDPDRWALLDFEYFGYGWRVFDIGTFLNNQIYQLDGVERAKSISDAFLSGYQTVRPLGRAELKALPSFVVLRQIWLLGMGAVNLPNIGLSLFRHWAFDRCMPLIRAWMQESWSG